MRMSKLERITVTMPAEMVAKLRAAVEAGEYATTSEIVREAMREWIDQQDRREAAMAKFREEIDKGLAGPFHDGETVMHELREYVAKLVREQAHDEAA
jgi:antitoxin ParD1/3/4